MFLHGAKDTFVDVGHSHDLLKECPSAHKRVVIRENMTHNQFDFYRDWAVPIGSFMFNLAKIKNGRRRVSSVEPEAGDPWILDEVFQQDIDFDRYFRRKRI